MNDIAEKRVYDDRRGETVVLVASETGLVRVAVAGDLVGRFSLARRESVRDVAVVVGAATAAGEDGAATAAGEDGAATAAGDGGAVVTAGADVFVDGEQTGFGAAVAVGGDGGRAVLAADEEGRVARLAGTDEEGAWDILGWTGTVRAVDAGLVAAADGVHRATPDGLAPAGLTDARDVAGGGAPLAATGDGLFVLGNGWLDCLDGPFRAVAAAPDGRAVAVGDALHARGSTGARWTRVALPDDVDAADVVDVGVGPDARYAVTVAGVVLADAGEGWRRRSLGVTGVRRLAVVADGPGAGGEGGDRSGADEEKAV